MSQKPELLPEAPPPSTPTPPRRSNKPFLWMLIVLLFVALGGVVGVVVVQPELIGLMRGSDIRLTDIAIAGTVTALADTESRLAATESRALSREVELRSTQAALVNAANRLQQTETQQVFNANITNTAVAVNNAQQATQAALNFASTQAALDQIGTQVQLDYQATQTALNRNLTPSAPPTVPSIFYLDENFASGIETAPFLQSVLTPAWGLTGDGVLQAQTDGATMLLRRDTLTEYVFEADITAVSGIYAMLFDMGGESLVLQWVFDGDQVSAIGLYPALGDVSAGRVAVGEAIALAPSIQLNAEGFRVRVVVSQGFMTASLNNLNLIQAPVTIRGGAIGVQLPAGARLNALRVDGLT